MKKNILVGIVIIIFAVAIGSSLLILGAMNRPAPQLDRSVDSESDLYLKDQAELDSFSEDLALSRQDSDLYSEIDQTYYDILDLDATALDEDLIVNEAASVDFSGDLDSSKNDDAALSDVDQSLNEVIQQ